MSNELLWELICVALEQLGSDSRRLSPLHSILWMSMSLAFLGPELLSL